MGQTGQGGRCSARPFSMLAALPLLLLTLVLVGCSQGEPPARSYEVAAKGLYASALSDNGGLAVVGSIHHGGSLWRFPENERLFNWNHREGEFSTITAADFSPERAFALTAESHTLVLWDTGSGEGLRFWTAPGEVLDLALGPQAAFALLGLSDFSAVVFDVKRGGVQRTLQHGDRVRSVALSQDGRVALTGSEDSTAVLWDLATGQARFTVQHDDAVQLVTLSADGTLALSVSKYDKAVLWRADSGEMLGEMPLRAEQLARGLRFTAARFSADNRWLLTGTSDQRVQLWSVPALKEMRRWRLPKRDAWKPTSAAVTALAFSDEPDRFIAVASNGFVHELRR